VTSWMEPGALLVVGDLLDGVRRPTGGGRPTGWSESTRPASTLRELICWGRHPRGDPHKTEQVNVLGVLTCSGSIDFLESRLAGGDRGRVSGWR
jgi:hypothetical protein